MKGTKQEAFSSGQQRIPGGLWESSGTTPPQEDFTSFPLWWGKGERVLGSEAGLRRGEWSPQATPPEPPPLSPAPLQCPTSNFWKNSAFLLERGKQGTWVSLVSPSPSPLLLRLGRLSEVGGNMASSSWHPPHNWRLAEVAASSQALAQLTGYSCCSQL